MCKNILTIIVLLYCLIAATLGAAENREWRYKNYIVREVTDPQDPLGPPIIHILKGDKLLTQLSGEALYFIPDAKHPARDITGSGHTEISIFSSSGGTSEPCCTLTLFELEPNFRQLGKFVIDENAWETQGLQKFPGKSGMAIIETSNSFCVDPESPCDKSLTRVSFLKDAIISYRNSHDVLEPSLMKTPPLSRHAMQKLIRSVSFDWKNANARSDNYSAIYQNSINLIYMGNGQQAKELIDSALMGNTIEKQRFFHKVMVDVCKGIHGSDIVAMSQLSCA